MTSAYRQLPAVETLVQAIQRRANGDAPPHELLVDAARAELDAARSAIAAGAAAPSIEHLIGATLARSHSAAQPSLRPLINATGVIIQTNLGRAPLSDAALRAMREVGMGYSNLEYDLATGERGSRAVHLTGLLCRLTGAEAALAVNNNAAAIYLALVVQFNSITQPLLVYAAVPFGVVGGLLGLSVMGSSFGFMAFLGVASLAGLIISHVIVLFDFIEEMKREGEPLRQAVVDAGLARLRPVLTTVLATVGGLIPLAMEGGPLWEPMCYVQIAGMLVATVVTLVIVPVLYVIFVEDLHLVRWETGSVEHKHQPRAELGTLNGSALNSAIH